MDQGDKNCALIPVLRVRKWYVALVLIEQYLITSGLVGGDVLDAARETSEDMDAWL